MALSLRRRCQVHPLGTRTYLVEGMVALKEDEINGEDSWKDQEKRNVGTLEPR